MYNEEALNSIYKYNMLFNNISNNNNTDEDAKFNTNLISDFDLENFDPKRYEYYTGLLKVFNNDPETLYNLLNKYNSIKSLKVKERKIIREINDYVNRIKNIKDGEQAGGAGISGGAGEIEKIKDKTRLLLEEVENKLIVKEGIGEKELIPGAKKFRDAIIILNTWVVNLTDENIINPNTEISTFKDVINLFKKAIAVYKESPSKGGSGLIENLTKSDTRGKTSGEEGESENTKKDAKKNKIDEQRKHEKIALTAEELVLSAEKLVAQINNAITHISEKTNKVKEGLDEVFSELDRDNSKEIKKEKLEIENDRKLKNKEVNFQVDKAIGLLKDAINTNIGVGSELYKIAAQDQQGTVGRRTIKDESSNSINKDADSAISSLKNAVTPSINIGDELYKVAKKASTAIENTEKKTEVDTKKITDAAEAEADKAINSLKDAIAPSISVGNELYKVADNVNKETEASTKKTEVDTKKITDAAEAEANSAIDSLKDAIAPSISVGNELYNIAEEAGKAIKKEAVAKEATNTKAEKGATTAAILAINSLKDAVAPSISVGNELYKVAEEANKAIKNEATEVDSAEANFIESIKGTALLNSISNIFDKFKGIEDLDIEKISPAATAEPTAPTTAATAAAAEQAAKAAKAAKDQAAAATATAAEQAAKALEAEQAAKALEAEQAAKALEAEQAAAKALEAEQAAAKAAAPYKDSQTNEDEDEDEDEESENDWNKTHEEGEDEWTEDNVNIMTDKKIKTEKKKLISLPPPKKEHLPPQDLIPLPQKYIGQGGGDPNQKYSDDNLKAQYLDTQRYNKIDDNKIINEYRERLSVNKNKVGRIKTDNKIEQLSNDIDVYNTLDFDEKESKEKTDNIIKKIKDFENDPKNPIEALELSFDDRIVFIIATFFIRYITIIMVQWCIDINIIKSFYEGFIYYAVIYIILFWFIVLFINIDNSFDVKYMNFNGIINSIRTLFYYFYMGTNGISRLLIHTSLILLLIVIPIILNIKKKPDFKDEDDQESIKILDYEERKQLSKALSLFTMFIWLFTSIIATKF